MAKLKEVVVTFLKHYHKDDTDCSGDYYDSEILVNNKVHDVLGGFDSDIEPESFYEGFIAGVKFAEKTCRAKYDHLQFEYDRVNDYE
jgi:hypothetical protein